jgi:hypothetical protein
MLAVKTQLGIIERTFSDNIHLLWIICRQVSYTGHFRRFYHHFAHFLGLAPDHTALR